ncbi:MAG: initiation control protein YabA [Desulfotomaculaceae bacterium]|nr:initiation control protein YabA [Desulfotomaculaceae bacterium]
MRALYKLTKDMEVKLHTLFNELQDLKNKARELDEENTRLRHSLAEAYRASGIIGAVETSHTGIGFMNLLELYDQGFHICNLHFGCKRAVECLFCMAVLKKGHKSAVEQG